MRLLLENPLDRYNIEEQVYRSERVQIYLVESKVDSKKYNLKKILPENAAEKSQILDEIALNQETSNLNILKYFDTYDYEEHIWLVVELFQSSLYQILTCRAGFIPEKFMAYISKQILLGLNYLHRDGRIHRDLKSKNVMISEFGEVKLGDFGFAAQISETTSLARANPSWMAPELFVDQEYSQAVDIWAFGILLFEMAEGEPPFVEENQQMDVIEQILNSPPPKLRNRLKWSKDFVGIVGACLRKNPKERPCAGELLVHPFIEDNDEETLQTQFAEYYNNFLPEIQQVIN